MYIIGGANQPCLSRPRVISRRRHTIINPMGAVRNQFRVSGLSSTSPRAMLPKRHRQALISTSKTMAIFQPLLFKDVVTYELPKPKKIVFVAIAACLTWLSLGPAGANGLGENYSWQFATTVDRTNRAYLEDLRQKKKSGFYAAPVYNTNIGRQYNCNIASTATGNQGTNSTVASSPTSTGNTAQAKGNDSQTGYDLFGFPGNVSADNAQTNNGKVLATTKGNIDTTVSKNNANQAINSTQGNAGAQQTATVNASTACSFGVLN